MNLPMLRRNAPLFLAVVMLAAACTGSGTAER